MTEVEKLKNQIIMKKQYSKPNMKCVKLRGAEQLMAASGDQLGINGNGDGKPTISGGNSGGILGNEEGMDIWGNNGSIWK